MSRKKILLAEDDGDDRDFFNLFLGQRTDILLLPVVENGEELFEYLEQLENEEGFPDAIILDQNMPRRNGLQTLELLKSESLYANIPVMVYSTYTDENLIKNSLALGAAVVLTKPTTMQGYHDMIDELFKFVLESKTS
jgi:CheY-like chemotaxis protein